LQTSVEFLKGIGSFKAELLRKELHISTYGDLLHYFPYRYIDGTQVQNIQSLQPDQEWVQLKGIIMNFNEHGSGFKKG
jgi:ATP-dependent DNA helicase RecG